MGGEIKFNGFNRGGLILWSACNSDKETEISVLP